MTKSNVMYNKIQFRTCLKLFFRLTTSMMRLTMLPTEHMQIWHFTEDQLERL